MLASERATGLLVGAPSGARAGLAIGQPRASLTLIDRQRSRWVRRRGARRLGHPTNSSPHEGGWFGSYAHGLRAAAAPGVRVGTEHKRPATLSDSATPATNRIRVVGSAGGFLGRAARAGPTGCGCLPPPHRTVHAVLPHTALRHRSPTGIRSRRLDRSGEAIDADSGAPFVVEAGDPVAACESVFGAGEDR